MRSRHYFNNPGFSFATALRLKYLEPAMSGTAVIVIVVLALVVVVGGSILVLGLNRREHHTPSNTYQAHNGGKPSTTGDQSDCPGN